MNTTIAGRPRYSIAKRFLMSFPGLKESMVDLYQALPTSLSSRLYGFFRKFFFPDKRAPYFKKAFEQIASSGIEGDYLEFGVFRGTSFTLAHELSRKHRVQKMRFFAFDSFEGLPESEGTTFVVGDMKCSASRFLKMIEKNGVDLKRVQTVPGFFNESLKPTVKVEHQLRKAAIIHCDADLYTSTRDILRFIGDLLQPGTIIIFDDWHSFSGEKNGAESFGERRAFQEWDQNSRFADFYDTGDWGRAFICRG